MFSSFSNHNFRIFFIAQSFSVIGTFAQEIAQAWLVLNLTHSATALGLVLGLQYLPMLVIAPWGGLLADRFSRRKLLIITQTAYSVCTFILWYLTFTHSIQAWMVFMFAFCFGVAGAINTPTRLTFLHDLVGEKDLHNAVSLNATFYSAGRIVGPVVAGIIIAAFGVAPCFLLNSVSYLGVVLALVSIRVHELQAAPKIVRASHQLRAGLDYIRGTPTIFAAILMTWLIGIFTYELPVSLPALAKITFHGNATTLAALSSAYGLGATIGGLANAKFKPSSPLALVKMAVILGLTVITTALLPSLLLAIIMMVAIGFGSVRFSSFANSTIQLASLPEMRGRVLAIWTSAYVGSTAIGGPIIGWVCQHANPRWGLGLGGLAAIAAAAIGWLFLDASTKGIVQEKLTST